MKKKKVELDLSNYVTKVYLKNGNSVGIFKFAKMFDLANLKSDVDKLDIDKLKNVIKSNLSNKTINYLSNKLETVPVD